MSGPILTAPRWRRAPSTGEPAVVTAKDVLAIAGIAPPMLRLYPIETAARGAKLRVKDLALLATVRAIDAKREPDRGTRGTPR
jgi:hypothetical protein